MIQNGWLIIVLGLFVAGCAAPVTYNHPSKPLAEKQRDTVECLAMANQAAYGAGNWSSDPAIRNAIFQNARDQYFAMCLESRGWVAGVTGQPRPTNQVSAEPPKDAERRCQQEALSLLGYYDLWRDGRDSWWWQQALQRYQTNKGLTMEDLEAAARLRTAIDNDLQAQGSVDRWRHCLVEAGIKGM
jgi:hypothetical protein